MKLQYSSIEPTRRNLRPRKPISNAPQMNYQYNYQIQTRFGSNPTSYTNSLSQPKQDKQRMTNQTMKRKPSVKSARTPATSSQKSSQTDFFDENTRPCTRSYVLSQQSLSRENSKTDENKIQSKTQQKTVTDHQTQSQTWTTKIEQLSTPPVKTRCRNPLSDISNFQNNSTISRSSKRYSRSRSRSINRKENTNNNTKGLSFNNQTTTTKKNKNSAKITTNAATTTTTTAVTTSKFSLSTLRKTEQKSPNIFDNAGFIDNPNDYLDGCQEYHKRNKHYSIQIFKEDYLRIPAQFAEIISHNQDDDVSSDEDVVKGGVKYNYKSILKELFTEEKIHLAPPLNNNYLCFD